MIFAGIASLLSVGSTSILLVLFFDAQISQAVLAANDIQSAFVDLFERIEILFRRLGTYIELPPTTNRTGIIVKVMAEVLIILAIVTRKIKRGKISEFVIRVGDMISCFDLSFFRKILEKASKKARVRYRRRLAKARQTNARGKPHGGFARSEGRA